MDNLPSKMLEYRAKRNITQNELAERCGLTVQTITNIERCKQNPSRLTAEKIRLVIEKEEE